MGIEKNGKACDKGQEQEVVLAPDTDRNFAGLLEIEIS